MADSAVPPAAKLSRQQRAILRKLAACYAAVEARGEPEGFGIGPSHLRLFGVPVPWLRGRKQYRPPADSASFSRALRRLEQRGLVLRVNGTSGSVDAGGRIRTRPDQSHSRADHVRLTDAGHKAANG